MKREFTVIIEQDSEGFFVSEAPDLPGCHTQAKSMDTLLERTREAVSLCLKQYRGRPRNKFVGVHRIVL